MSNLELQYPPSATPMCHMEDIKPLSSSTPPMSCRDSEHQSRHLFLVDWATWLIMPLSLVCTAWDFTLLSHCKSYLHPEDNVSHHFVEQWQWRHCCRTVTELISLQDLCSGRWHSRTAALNNRVWFVPNSHCPFWWLLSHTQKIHLGDFSSLSSSVYLLYFCLSATPSFMSCNLFFLSVLNLFYLSVVRCWFLIFLSPVLPFLSTSLLTVLSFFWCLFALHYNISACSSEGTLVIWYAVIVAFFS